MSHRERRRHLQCWKIREGAGVFFVLLLGISTCHAETQVRYEFLQIRMGIPVNIVLYAPSEDIANLASKAAYDRFREIDRSMSDYDPDSELMQLCRNAVPGQPVAVSDDLMTVLCESQKLSRETNGAFDVTVGPIVKLWRIARRRKQLPNQDRLAEALKAVGFESVELVQAKKRVTLKKPDMQIDLGAIAKGYAADQALKSMKEHGVTRALIDAGGDVVVGDPPPDREHWLIDVEKLKGPDDESPPPQIRLRNAAVATSGDVYQHLEINGQRYSHIVNPQTGLGLTTPSTVTIIAPTGMQSDALASAVSVLGAEKGVALIECKDFVEAFIVTAGQDGALIEASSRGFTRYLVKDSRQTDTSD